MWIACFLAEEENLDELFYTLHPKMKARSEILIVVSNQFESEEDRGIKSMRPAHMLLPGPAIVRNLRLVL